MWLWGGLQTSPSREPQLVCFPYSPVLSQETPLQWYLLKITEGGTVTRTPCGACVLLAGGLCQAPLLWLVCLSSLEWDGVLPPRVKQL